MKEYNIVFDGRVLVAWGFSDSVATEMINAGLDVMKVDEDIIWDVRGVKAKHESN